MKQTLDKSEGIDQRAVRRAWKSLIHAEKQDLLNALIFNQI